MAECKYPDIYNYQNECLNKCPQNYFAKPNGNEYICVLACDDESVTDAKSYYYEPERICRESCKDGDYIIQGTHECTNYCNPNGQDIQYHFYIPKVDGTAGENDITKRTCVTKCPNNKRFLRENNYCQENCDDQFFNYYVAGIFECRQNCPPNMKIRDTNKQIFECVDNCPISPEEYFEDSDKRCILSCEDSISRYKY